VRVLDLVFDEMRRELERGREVEFPFGCLKRVKRVSREWELIGDEPMKPYTVEHQLDAAGYKLLNGEGDPDELALITFERTGKVPVRKPLTGKQVEVTGR